MTMADPYRSCSKNFKVWVAFLAGMVLVVIAIVVFDRTLGLGNLGVAAPGAARMGQGATDLPAGQGTYLSLTGGSAASPSAWLGIEATDLPELSAKKLGLDISGGVLVSKVLPGSPAAVDGLLRGDVIYDLAHRKVTSLDELVRVLGKLDPGDRVRVLVLRAGAREVLYVKLGTAPVSTPSVRTVAGDFEPADLQLKWGIAVSELTPSLRAASDIPKRETGVLIVMVVPGSAAQRAGLRVGDLIKQVDREPVESLADFFKVLSASSRHVLLKVYRGGSEILVHVVAVSPMMPAGGSSTTTTEDDEEEVKGYKGQPVPFPPMGKPGSTSALTPAPAPAATEASS
jgi:serine protease Do